MTPVDPHLTTARAAAAAVYAAEAAMTAADNVMRLVLEDGDRKGIQQAATDATRCAARSTRKAAEARAAVAMLRAAYESPDPVTLRTALVGALAAESAAHRATRVAHAARRAAFRIVVER